MKTRIQTMFRRQGKLIVGGAAVLLVLSQGHAAVTTTLFNEDFASLSEWSLGVSGTTPWTTMLNDGDETVAIAGGSPINTYAMPSQNQVYPAGIAKPLDADTVLDVNLDVRIKQFAASREFKYSLFSENPQTSNDVSSIAVSVRHPSNAALGSSIKLVIRQARGVDPADDVTVYDSGFTAVTLGDDGDPFPINVSRNGAGLWTVTVDGSGLISGTESQLSTGLKFDYIRFEEFADGGGGAERRVFDNFSVLYTVPEPASASLVGLGLAGLLLRRRSAKR